MSRKQMDVFDAAMLYKAENRDVIILAGKDYGCGSSRDWAAKGPLLLVSHYPTRHYIKPLHATFMYPPYVWLSH